jgi:exopolysaccharide production protein ExoQ
VAYPALLLTLCFIVWLLVRDSQRRPTFSGFLWVPTLFVMVLGSRPVSYWFEVRQYNGYTGEEGSAGLVDEAFFLLFIGASFFVASSRGERWGRLLTMNLTFLMIYLFYAISIMWSGDPLGSSKRLIKDFGLLLVIAAIFSEKEPIEALRAVYFRSACVLIPLSIVFDKYFPRFAREYTKNGQPLLSGVTGQKNSLGEMVFIFGIFIVWDYLEQRKTRIRGRIWRQWDHITLFLMGIVLLYHCQSKTALLCLMIGCALSIRSGWLASSKISRLAFYGAFATPFLLFFSQEFSYAIQPIVAAMGRDMTFTGRANIWNQITWNTVNPIVGYGYWNFWGSDKGLAIADNMETTIPNAHCGYVDVYLDGGMIGLAIIFLFLLTYGNRLTAKRRPDRFQLVRIAVLCSAIIYNLSESSLTRVGLLWFTTIAMVVSFPEIRRTRIQRDVVRLEGKREGISEMKPMGTSVARRA